MTIRIRKQTGAWLIEVRKLSSDPPPPPLHIGVMVDQHMLYDQFVRDVYNRLSEDDGPLNVIFYYIGRQSDLLGIRFTRIIEIPGPVRHPIMWKEIRQRARTCIEAPPYVIERIEDVSTFKPRGRCKAKYFTTDGDRLRCSLETGHKNKHRAWMKGSVKDVQSGQRLEYNDIIEWTGDKGGDIPTVKAPVYAFRAWYLTLPKGEDFALTAEVAKGDKLDMNRSKFVYEGPVGMNKNPPTFRGFGDGFYSYTDLQVAIAHRPRRPVYGKIELLKHVVEHSYGYRSQGVRIDKLWVCRRDLEKHVPLLVHTPEDIAESLERRYHCDVELILDNYDLVDDDPESLGF